MDELAKFAKASPEEKQRLFEQLRLNLVKKCSSNQPEAMKYNEIKQQADTVVSKEEKPDKPPLFKNCQIKDDRTRKWL